MDFEATDGPVPFDDMEEGYTKTFVHQVFKKGIQIKRETIDDSMILDMKNQTSNITDSANRTMEQFVHAPFNYCTSATFNLAKKTFDNVGADGVVLVSDSHTSKTGKVATQSNILTAALSATALTAAENLMKGFKTEGGNKGNFKGDTLIVPFELRDIAWELVGSPNKPGGSLNDINTKYSKYKLIISDWLTDATNWYLCDSRYMRKNLFWLDRKELEIDSWVDKNSGIWNVSGYMRYSLGWNDWRWIVGNIVTG